MSEWLLALEGKMANMEEGYNKLLALGQEQTAILVCAYRAIAALSTIMTAQQDQVAVMRERMIQAKERLDAMREMILALEHTQANPIVIDDEGMVVSDRVDGEELEVEENEVAIPIPAPCHCYSHLTQLSLDSFYFLFR